MAGRRWTLGLLFGALVACQASEGAPEDAPTETGGSAGAGVGTGGSPSSGGVSGAAAGSGLGGAAGQALGGAPGNGGVTSGGLGGVGAIGQSGAAGQSGGVGGVSAGDGGSGGISGVGGSASGSAGSPAGGAGAGGSNAGSSGSGGSGGVAGKGGTSGASGAAGAAGTSGAAGAAGSSSTGLIGWASVAGSGVTTTTGGGNATPTEVRTIAELTSAVAGGTARVVRIFGTITVTGDLLDIGSNKTLVGDGTTATIVGGLKIDGESNVIVRNLRVNAKTAAGVGDGITINTAHHVWVDHCEVWDAPDGNLDITDGSDFVTVSWSKFWYSASPGAEAHRFSNLIGGSDTSTTDTGKLSVTYHHNWWADRVVERMPRGRFGAIHVFNNYHTATGNTRGVQAGTQARMLVENNVFVGTNNPHITTEDGQILASGNSYSGTTGSQSNNATFNGSIFTYGYTLDPVANVAALVQANVGPRGQ